MDLKDIVEPEAVIAGLHATSKKHLLQEIAQRAEDALDIESRVIFDAMLERERPMRRATNSCVIPGRSRSRL